MREICKNLQVFLAEREKLCYTDMKSSCPYGPEAAGRVRGKGDRSSMSQTPRRHYSDIDAVDILHQVSAIYMSTKTPHDYGTGDIYTVAEVHTLKYIADNRGITVTQLARDNGKTKGAVSQILKKLESKGLVYREADPENDKRNHLYLTDKGRRLDQAHRQYDTGRFGESMDVVRTRFSQEEIDTTFSVLEAWLEVRRQVQEKRVRQKKLLERQKRREAAEEAEKTAG